jgi:hypothetical protein
MNRNNQMRTKVFFLILLAAGAAVAAVPAARYCFGRKDRAAAEACATACGTSGAAGTQAETAKPPRSAAPAETKPAEAGQAEREWLRLDLEGGVQVFWSSGDQGLRGLKDGAEVWALDLDFHVVGVRKGGAPGEAVVSSVDGLSSARLDARTGKVLEISRPGSTAEATAETKLLVAQAKAAYAEALRKHREQDQEAALAGVQTLLNLAGRLSRLGRQTDSFRVWAAARGLQKAIEPRAAAEKLPPPRLPPALPDELEF